MEQIKLAVADVCRELFGADVQVELGRTDEKFGDYSTNVALQLAGRLGKNPREVATALQPAIAAKLAFLAKDVAIAGPGFINITLGDTALFELAQRQPAKTYEGQNVVAEYSDPNPFKVLHAGHLYTSIVGDAVANLIEKAGGTVHRVNFGGDVGLHVAKTMWAIIRELGAEDPAALEAIPPDQRAQWLSDCYVSGNNAYDDIETAKESIQTYNKRVYEVHAANDHDSPFAQIYWTTRQWSYDYFDAFYARIGTHFEKYYPESQTAPLGLAKAQELLAKGVLVQSDGAAVFKGEDHGLHTRVFITAQGLPTYEAKDLGLILAKWQDYKFDRSVIITGNDIIEYMKVVLKVVEQVAPPLAQATTHITHGIVKLGGGTKMSSRKGNILRAMDILDAADRANQAQTGKQDDRVTLGAVKYAFIKNRIGADIIFDPEESVSLHGNSGPYLQYAHARACSVLRKAEGAKAGETEELEPGERSLLRKIGEYPEVVERATAELLPHHVATYLYELAQGFNQFYEHNRVLGDDRQPVRLGLVQRYADTLKAGLELLNITAPDSM